MNGPIRVVIADDAEDIRRLLRVHLQLQGDFEIVGEAGDGEQAVNVVCRERPDAVVLDLAMPVMDGLQAIPLIRGRSPLTRIVVLSGFNAAKMAPEARALGADAYLEKGTAFEDLAGLLRELSGAGAARLAGGTVEVAEPVRMDALEAPMSFAATLAGAPDLATAFEVFAGVAFEIMSFGRASFAVATEEPRRFRVLATAGSDAWRLPVGAFVSVDGEGADVLGHGTPWVVPDTAARSDLPVARELRARGIRSFVSVPIVVAGGLHALVSFSSVEPHAVNPVVVPDLAAAVGEVAAVLHVLALLDGERQVTRRLRDLDRLRNDFVGMVAHDLRSPMTAIAGSAECLERGWSQLGEPEKLELVGSISRNIRGLAALVEDVLTVAHLQSGEFHLDLRPTDLVELVTRTVDELRTCAKGREIHLDVGALPVVPADPTRHRQVLTNLVVNALKFSPADRPVVVTATVVGGAVQVAVRDEGIGVAPADVPRLFDRFFRTDEARRHDGKGTGLGLYICKSLVESWGGAVGVDSAPGAGSTFSYTVPLSVPGLPGEPHYPAPATA